MTDDIGYKALNGRIIVRTTGTVSVYELVAADNFTFSSSPKHTIVESTIDYLPVGEEVVLIPDKILNHSALQIRVSSDPVEIFNVMNYLTALSKNKGEYNAYCRMTKARIVNMYRAIYATDVVAIKTSSNLLDAIENKDTDVTYGGTTDTTNKDK